MYKEDSAVAVELKRLGMGQGMAKLDVARYAVAPPAEGEVSDPGAWRRAISNAKSQLEHQTVRADNAELLRDYGPAHMQQYIRYLEGAKVDVAGRHDDLKRKIEDINKSRKTEQLAAGTRLQGLEQKWKDLVFNNRQIEQSCEDLEADIKRLKGDAMETS
jgi:pre-mRNA-splicing factor SPF27